MELFFLIAVLALGFAVAFGLAVGALTLVVNTMAPTSAAIGRPSFDIRDDSLHGSVFQN